MRQCPECNRVYYDETLNFCLDDGASLIQGLSSEGHGTAILPSGDLSSESPTRLHISRDPGERVSQQHLHQPLLTLSSRRNKILLAVVLPAVLILSGFLAYRYLYPSGAKQINSVAVLPFVNESGNADVDYLSDGLTESLIGSLSQLPQLSVKARSSVFRYKGQDVDLRKAGSDLGVEALLTGRMLQRGNDVTLYAELVEASTERVLWKGEYHRRMTDLAALESEMSRDISGELRAKLTGAESNRVATRNTENARAYELYLKGRYVAAHDVSKEGFNKSVDYYRQAIDLDPGYALAYAGLAQAYMELGGVFGFMPPGETYPKAHDALERALSIDDNLAAAHSSLADFYLVYEWNWPASEKEFKRAIELDPNDPDSHRSYGTYLQSIGRYDDATRERRTARDLDPLSPIVVADVGYPLYYARRCDEAIEHFREGLGLDPNLSWAHLWIGQCLLDMKRYDEALAEIERANQLAPGDVRTLATLGYGYAVANRRGDALNIIEQLQATSNQQYVSPYFFAVIYSGMNDKDKAFEYLGRAVAERHPYLILTKVEPFFDNLRSDPRWNDLLRRIGIPQ